MNCPTRKLCHDIKHHRQADPGKTPLNPFLVKRGDSPDFQVSRTRCLHPVECSDITGAFFVCREGGGAEERASLLTTSSTPATTATTPKPPQPSSSCSPRHGGCFPPSASRLPGAEAPRTSGVSGFLGEASLPPFALSVPFTPFPASTSPLLEAESPPRPAGDPVTLSGSCLPMMPACPPPGRTSGAATVGGGMLFALVSASSSPDPNIPERSAVGGHSETQSPKPGPCAGRAAATPRA